MPTSPDDEPWPSRFLHLLALHATEDAAHNPMHIRRVVANARRLATAENADWLVVMPAAWLHDCVIIPKSSPDRSRASQLAATQAVIWLEEIEWPHGRMEEIAHAIEAHSYTAGIAPKTLEAQVLQDADRLDALGAVGLARTLMLGAELKRGLYDAVDPFCHFREADDSVFTLDHLYCKLLKLEGTMQTESGRTEAHQRTGFLRSFLKQLETEIA
jgi:uncharacterized protein